MKRVWRCARANAFTLSHACSKRCVFQTLQFRYTLDDEVLRKPVTYHVPVFRDELTKNLDGILPELQDELVTSLSEYIPITDGACLRMA